PEHESYAYYELKGISKDNKMQWEPAFSLTQADPYWGGSDAFINGDSITVVGEDLHSFESLGLPQPKLVKTGMNAHEGINSWSAYSVVKNITLTTIQVDGTRNVETIAMPDGVYSTGSSLLYGENIVFNGIDPTNRHVKITVYNLRKRQVVADALFKRTDDRIIKQDELTVVYRNKH
ncbi:MAG: hypothetical protein ACRC5C_07590, partial [Bacilli bacterium]